MNKITNEVYKSIRYIVPIIIGFIGIIALQNYDNIINFIKFNSTVIRDVMAPFVIGFVIAYILNQPMKLLEKKFKLKRGLNVLIIYGILALTIVVAWLYVVPVIQSSIIDLTMYIPEGIKQLETMFTNIAAELNITMRSPEVWAQIEEFITTKLIPLLTSTTTIVTDALLGFISTVVGYTLNIVLGIVVSVYLLLSKEKSLQVVHDIGGIIFGEKYEAIKEFGSTLDRNIGIYIVAKAMDSAIYATVCTIILYVLKSQYALFVGVIIGITNMIPFFGPIIGTAVATIINLFFSFEKAVIVLIAMIIVQQLESLILEPYFVGKQVGVPPILTMFAVTLAGKYTGFVGMMLSVPITGVLIIYINKFIEKKKQKSVLEIE